MTSDNVVNSIKENKNYNENHKATFYDSYLTILAQLNYAVSQRNAYFLQYYENTYFRDRRLDRFCNALSITVFKVLTDRPIFMLSLITEGKPVLQCFQN